MSNDTVERLNKKASEIIRGNAIKGILSYNKNLNSILQIIDLNIVELASITANGGMSLSDAIQAFHSYMTNNLSLLKCTGLSIYETFKKSIELGLYWDEYAGEIWVSSYIDEDTKEEKMTYMVGTKGLQKIAKRVANPPIHHFSTNFDGQNFTAEIYWENYPEKSTHTIKATDYQKFVASIKRSTYFHQHYPERMGQYLAMRELLRPMHLDWVISSEIIKQEKFEQGF